MQRWHSASRPTGANDAGTTAPMAHSCFCTSLAEKKREIPHHRRLQNMSSSRREARSRAWRSVPIGWRSRIPWDLLKVRGMSLERESSEIKQRPVRSAHFLQKYSITLLSYKNIRSRTRDAVKEGITEKPRATNVDNSPLYIKDKLACQLKEKWSSL